MTRVSELQKGHEMVVVDSRKLLPFSFQFFSCLGSVFAEEVGDFGFSCGFKQGFAESIL